MVLFDAFELENTGSKFTFPTAKLHATREQFRRTSGLAPSLKAKASCVAPFNTSSVFTSSFIKIRGRGEVRRSKH